MEGGAKIPLWLSELAQQLPSLITILVCMVLVIARWKRHPTVLFAGGYRSLPVVAACPFFHVDLCPGTITFSRKQLQFRGHPQTVFGSGFDFQQHAGDRVRTFAGGDLYWTASLRSRKRRK
jgi:hypothetical protein